MSERSNVLAAAYTAVGDAWSDGPTRIYGRLADELVAASPCPLDGARVLDAGAGTGAGSRAAARAGGQVVAVDLALGMLRVDRHCRPPAVAGDVSALPFAAATFDVVLAPFSLNHLTEPTAGVAEAARVLRPGGVLLASTYAIDDDHVAKAAVDAALTEAGWAVPSWYTEVKAAMATCGTIERAAALVARGGMAAVFVERREVAFPELSPIDLVAWRMGMAHTAPFVTTLDRAARDTVVQRSLDRLGERPPTLVRRVLFIAAT